MTFLDWAIIGLYFVFAAAIGLAMSRRAGASVSEFFVGGRSLPWWLAGTSMLEAVEAALRLYDGPPPELWLYRGAWQEWSVNEAIVLVPLSEEELRRKIQAIFKHESQKDSAPFPGPDPREFWQRVVDRNKGTAELLRGLGLPAYFAMEAYVTLSEGRRMEGPEVATSTLGETRS